MSANLVASGIYILSTTLNSPIVSAIGSKGGNHLLNFLPILAAYAGTVLAGVLLSFVLDEPNGKINYGMLFFILLFILKEKIHFASK